MPAHLQEAMSFGVQSMLELSHVLVLFGIDIVIGKVNSQSLQVELHVALLLLYVITMTPSSYAPILPTETATVQVHASVCSQVKHQTSFCVVQSAVISEAACKRADVRAARPHGTSDCRTRTLIPTYCKCIFEYGCNHFPAKPCTDMLCFNHFRDDSFRHG